MGPITDLVQVRYKPVLFAGLLNHWGHRGPAEIPKKRIFTYQHVTWMARRQGISLTFPPGHPFNPLKALRLALVCENKPEAVTTIFRSIWQAGGDPSDDRWLQNTATDLGVQDPLDQLSSPAIKSALRNNTEEAVSKGLFGVPTFLAGEHLFWGFDATEMVLDYLHNPKMFEEEPMKRVAQLPQAVSRVPKT